MSQQNVSRRGILKFATAGIVGLAVGFGGGWFSRQPQVIEKEKLVERTITETVTVEREMEKPIPDIIQAEIKFGMLPGTEYAPLYIGIARGIYKKYGLEIEELFFANPVDLVTALGTGEIQFGFAPSSFWIAANANQDLPIKILAGVGKGGYYYASKGDSDIYTVSDWKGKKIGSRGATGLITLAAMELLRKYGMDPTKDVEFVHFFGTPVEYLASLDRGEIDVIGLWEPWAQIALGRGHRIITSYDEIWPHHPECVLVGNADLIKEKPKIALNLIRGYKESINYVYTNLDDTAEFVSEKFKIDPNVTRLSLLSQPVNWRLTEEEIERIIDLMFRYDVIKEKVSADRVADLSFLREVYLDVMT